MGKPDIPDPAWRELAVLDYPGAQQAAVLGLIDLLGFAVHEADIQGSTARIAVSHWRCTAPEAAPQRISASPGGAFPSAVILPPAMGPLPQPGASPLTQWLRQAGAAGTILASACAGAFLLGEAGLLDRRPATTHWAYDAEFRARFPAVALDTDRLLIDDGDIITAGGIMAWTDLGLRLIDRFMGLDVMLATARGFLIDPPGREQSQYRVFRPNFDHGDSAVLKAQRTLHERRRDAIALGDLGDLAGLQSRTLQRRFRKATGMTVQDYQQNLRIAHAQDLLATSNLSTETVAWDAGYADVTSFRKVFGKITRLTPGEYRRRMQRKL